MRSKPLAAEYAVARISRRWLVVPTVFAAAWLLLSSAFVSASRAAEYQLKIIAQPGDVIDGRTIDRFSFDPTNVAINNDGEVAFFAGVVSPEGAGYAVMTQRRFIAGAGKLVDATYPRFNNEDHQVDINNRGEVVYTAYLPGGGRGLFVNEDLRFRPGDEVDGRVLTIVGRYGSINDAGTLVFDGQHTNDTTPAVFSQSAVLAEYGQVHEGFTFGAMGAPRIGNDGTIAYYAGLIETDRTAVAAPDRIVLKEGDVVGGVEVSYIDGIGSITNRGEVVVSIKHGEWPDWQEYVVTQHRVLFRPYEHIAGEMVGWLTGTNVVLNNRDEIALLGAVLNAQGVHIRDALFAGGRIVASEGDVFDGRVIAKIYPNFDMNDLGDVAFRVEFEDGYRAVILATVPEPSTPTLLAVPALTVFLRLRRRVRLRIRRRAGVSRGISRSNHGELLRPPVISFVPLPFQQENCHDMVVIQTTATT